MFIKRIAAYPFLQIICRPGAEREEEIAYPTNPGIGAVYLSGRLTSMALQADQEKAG